MFQKIMVQALCLRENVNEGERTSKSFHSLTMQGL
jgi:hypothetical protein